MMIIKMIGHFMQPPASVMVEAMEAYIAVINKHLPYPLQDYSLPERPIIGLVESAFRFGDEVRAEVTMFEKKPDVQPDLVYVLE